MNASVVTKHPVSLRCAAALVAAIALAAPTLARANTERAPSAPTSAAAEAPATAGEPAAATAGVPIAEATQVDAPAPQPSSRGSFSAGRMIVEMLASGIVGTLVGYGVYDAAGGDGIGPVMAGLGAEIVVAPLVAYGTGRAMGGRGTLSMTYLGGLLAFSGPSATPQQASISFAVGMALMPVTSALMFEVSSHVRSKRAAAVVRAAAITPTTDGHGVTGLRASVGLAF